MAVWSPNTLINRHVLVIANSILCFQVVNDRADQTALYTFEQNRSLLTGQSLHLRRNQLGVLSVFEYSQLWRLAVTSRAVPWYIYPLSILYMALSVLMSRTRPNRVPRTNEISRAASSQVRINFRGQARDQTELSFLDLATDTCDSR